MLKFRDYVLKAKHRYLCATKSHRLLDCNETHENLDCFEISYEIKLDPVGKHARGGAQREKSDFYVALTMIFCSITLVFGKIQSSVSQIISLSNRFETHTA